MGTRTERPGKARRYEMLDVWRGAICLLVVLEHVGVVLWEGTDPLFSWSGTPRQWLVWALQLNIGTALFFVISGYCIASSVESALRKGQGPSAFLGRRLWRIYPTYWAALLGFVVVVAVLDVFGLTRLHESDLALAVASPGTLSWPQWLGNLTLTETWRPLLGGGNSSVYTRVAWSLCYQEQFYLVCFVAMWLAPKRLYLFMASATALFVLLRVCLGDVGMLERIDGTFLLYWHEFAVGLVVYWRLTAKPSKTAEYAVNVGLAALFAVGVSAGDRSTSAAAGFGLLLIAMHRWDAAVGRSVWLEPFRACGRRSFSIYLTHVPVVMVLNVVLFDLGLYEFSSRLLVIVPVVTAVSLAVGFGFHRVVERRFTGDPRFPTLAIGERAPGTVAATAA